MKKNIISAAILLAAAVMAASCAKEPQSTDPSSGGDVIFTGEIEPFGATKTTLNSTHVVEWDSSDVIRINDGFFSVEPDSSDPTKATFTFNGSGTEPTSGPYTAYYPSTLFDGTKLCLPNTQIYTEGKITNCPMAATSENGYFRFHNLCGIVEFTFKGTATISKILVESNVALCGEFEIDDEYTAVLTKDQAIHGEKSITLDCGDGVTLNNDSGVKFWIALPWGGYPLTFTVFDIYGRIFRQSTIGDNVKVDANNIYAFTQTPAFTEDGYLCFTAKEAGAAVAIKKEGTFTPNALEYMTIIDGSRSSWTDLPYGTLHPALTNVGDKVYIRAKEARTTAQSSSNYVHFLSTKNVEVSGNIMYLVDPTGLSTTVGAYEFYRLFSDCSYLTNAGQLVLPATELSKGCYSNMFEGCTALTAAPVLPAPTMAASCYAYMFQDCWSLTSITCLATYIGAEMATLNWVEGVGEDGTFTIASGMESAWNGMMPRCGKPEDFEYAYAD